jgi:hypothetical protein
MIDLEHLVRDAIESAYGVRWESLGHDRVRLLLVAEAVWTAACERMGAGGDLDALTTRALDASGLAAPAPESAASDPLRAVRALCDHYLVSSVPARVLARHVLDALDATPTRDTTYSEYVAAKMAGELNE